MSHTELRQKMLHDVASRTVRFDEAENVIALSAQGQKARGDGRDTRPREQTVISALQLRQQELQLLQSRIGRTRVEKSLSLAAQIALRLAGIVERELHRLVDRRHQRTIVLCDPNGGRMVH